MAHLRAFGVDWPLQGTGSEQRITEPLGLAPGLQLVPGSLSGTITDGMADLRFAVRGRGGHVRARVTFGVDGGTVKRPRAGKSGSVEVFDQYPYGLATPTQQLSLAAGIAFPQRDNNLALRVNADGELLIAFLNNEDEDWQGRRPNSPVVIAPTPEFALSLNLGTGQWRLASDSLFLHLHAPSLGAAPPYQSPLTTLRQVGALTLDAFAWSAPPEIVFRVPGSDDPRTRPPPRPIFLYVNSPGGRLRAGMWATSAQLQVRFSGQRAPWAPGGGEFIGDRFSLESIVLVRIGRADYVLTCAGLSDASGAPLTLSCTDPITLGAAGASRRPGSVGHLVLAPQQEQTLRPAATIATSVFGPVRAVSFEILDPSQRQPLRLVVPALAGAPTNAAYCTSTVPRLTASTVNARLRMVTARPGESWDPKAAQASGQWVHQGQVLTLPLTPEVLWDVEEPDKTLAKSEVDRLLRLFEETEAPAWHDSGIVEQASTNGVSKTRVNAVVTLKDAHPVIAGGASAVASRRDPPPVVLQDHDVDQDFHWLRAVLKRTAQQGARNMQRVLLDSMDAFAGSAERLLAQPLAELKDFLQLVSASTQLPSVRGYRYARPGDSTTLKAIIKVGRGESVVDMLGDPRLLDAGVGGESELAKFRLCEVYRQVPSSDAADPMAPPAAFGTTRDAFENMLPEAVRTKDWVGILLLNVEVTLLSPLLRVLIKPDGPEGSHVAVVPFLAISGGAGGLQALSTRLRQVRLPKAPTNEPRLQEDGEEATHQVQHFDLLIEGGKFTLFDFHSRLHFKTLFGLKADKQVTRPPDGATEGRPTGIELRGRLQQVDGKTQLMFGGAVEPPLALLDPETVNGLTIFPITQATISRIGLVMHGEDVRVTLDGSVTPRKFMWPSFGSAETLIEAVSFQGLGLRLPEMTSDVLSWLKFSYPSMRFALDLPSVELFGSMKLSFSGFALQLPGVAPLSWDVRLNDVELNPDWSWFAFDLDFRFAGLPELATSDRKDLTFRLRLGLPFGQPDRWNLTECALTLSALSFEPLELNFARVFSLCADKLKVDSQTKRIEMENMSLSVLDTTIVQGLTAYVQPQQDSDHAFLVKWQPDSCKIDVPPDPRRGACPACVSDGVASGDLGILGIEWVLGGRGLALNATDAKNLLTIPLKSEDDDKPSRPELVKDPLKLLARDGGIAPNPDWFFAAEITVPSRKNKDASAAPQAESSELSPLTGRLLFHDRRYYGFSLKGRFFKELFQSDLVITALYIKGRSRDTDSFYVAFTVPMVAMGVYSFQGGMISLQAFCNGDFIFDCGFPTIAPGGGRHWERALGLILTPFQGSGGFYLAKLTAKPGEFGHSQNELDDLRNRGLTWLPTTLAELTNGDLKLFELRAGLAAQVGLGAVYSSGPVTGWVTIGVFLVMEGRLTILFKGSAAHTIVGVQLQCGIGIVIRGGAQLDWWIISVRIEVVASAEARATLSYGVDSNLLSYAQSSGCGAAGLQDVTLNLTFDLYCSVSASACIGSKPFRVCKGITVQLHMPVHYCLKLGKIS